MKTLTAYVPDAHSTWSNRGTCSGMDSDGWIFFSDNALDQEAAKRICAECPVKRECLDWALDNSEYGTWGGQTEKERRVTVRARGTRK